MARRLLSCAEEITVLEEGATNLELIEALVKQKTFGAVIEASPPKLLTVDNVASGLLRAKNLKDFLESAPGHRAQKIVPGETPLKSLVASMKGKYVFVSEKGEVRGIATPRSLFKAFRGRASLSHVGRILTETALPVVVPNTTILGILRRMCKRKCIFAVLHSKGRVRGVISIHNVLAMLVDDEFLPKVLRNEDDYYFYATACNLELDREGIVPSSEFSKRKLVEVLSNHGYLVISRRGYLSAFYDDVSLSEYVKRLAVM